MILGKSYPMKYWGICAGCNTNIGTTESACRGYVALFAVHVRMMRRFFVLGIQYVRFLLGTFEDMLIRVINNHRISNGEWWNYVFS